MKYAKLDNQGNVVEVKDLGDGNIKIRAGTDGLPLARPLVDVRPNLAGPWESYGSFSYVVEDDQVKRVFPVVSDTAGYKSEALQAIDQKAEELRQGFITSGAGQAMVYQEKTAEVARFDNDQSPQAGNYPLINAGATAASRTLAEEVAVIKAVTAQWVAVATLIEQIRLTGKAAVTAALTGSEIKTAYEAVDWSSVPTP